MIINEKYLQDIDDEDEEVAVSDEIANNRYDFEMTMEYRREVPIWGYIQGGWRPDELPGLSTDDFLDYKDRLEIILDALYIVQDYSIRMWTQDQDRIPFDTDDMSKYKTKVFDEKYIEIPTVRIRFNTYATPTYKKFYEVIQKLCISYMKFIDVFDYYKEDSSDRDGYLSVTVNGFLIDGFKNIAYKLKSHFDSIMGLKDEMEIPDRKEFRYIGENANHISPNS